MTRDALLHNGFCFLILRQKDWAAHSVFSVEEGSMSRKKSFQVMFPWRSYTRTTTHPVWLGLFVVGYLHVVDTVVIIIAPVRSLGVFF